jgi:folylpolyglutamate synthase/dihydropteroate synthase
VQVGVHWLLDVAHNTAGVVSLTRVLDRLDLPRPRIALVGVLGDKEWEEMLPPLLERMDGAILSQPPSAPPERRWDPREVADRVRNRFDGADSGGGSFLQVIPDFTRAMEEAGRLGAGGTVVVTGSCHTVGDGLRHLHVEPFPEE